MLVPPRPRTSSSFSMSEGRTSALPRLSAAANPTHWDTNCGSVHSGSVTPARMSALPRLMRTPSGTSVVNMPIHATYSIYPKMLEPASDILKRPVNPLQPPAIRRSHMLETVEPHLMNEERSRQMKQREYYRYHNTWKNYYYGTPAEKEAHRADTRSMLKQQMDDKKFSKRQANVEKFRETQMAYNTDMQNRLDDSAHHARRNIYLKSFRDENKMIMEFQWQDRKRGKLNTDRIDREIAADNPINWSGTLK